MMKDLEMTPLLKQIEDIQAFLLSCSWAKSGKDFFEGLAEYLANTLEVDFVCIDRLLEDGQEAQTVAIYHNGQFEDNIRYKLEETPCGKVVQESICFFPTNVRALFPEDALLQEMVAESYAGITLFGSDCQPIGLIAVIGKKPLKDPQMTEIILKQASIRTAGELEHRQLEETILQSHSELEVLVKERTEELLQSNNHLRALTQRMDAIAEEERTRIAREIHDELGHILTALKFDIEGLSFKPELAGQEAKSEVETIISMIDSLIDSVRKIATELRPGILDHLGLFPAIEWLMNQFHSRTKISYFLSIPEEETNFNKNETTIIFRILQEILTNITRHARASKVELRIVKSKQHFSLKISDDGVGFKVDDKFNSHSLGLLGMQERALSIGGKIKIDSKVGKGTTVIFSLDCRDLN